MQHSTYAEIKLQKHPITSSTATQARGAPRSSQICAASWQRGSKAAKYGVPCIPWLGLGTSLPWLGAAGLRAHSGSAAKISQLHSASLVEGEAQETQVVMDGLSHPGRRKGPPPRAKAQLHSNPTGLAAPCPLKHNFPAAAGTKEHHMKRQTWGAASGLTSVLS